MKEQQNGYILPALLFTMAFISLLIVIVTSLSVNTYNLAARESYRVNSQLAVDAGLDRALMELTADETYTGTGGEIDLIDNGNVRTTYETTILDTA